MKEFIVGIVLAVAGAVASYFIFRPSPVAFATCRPLDGSAPLAISCVNASNYAGHVIWDLGDASVDKIKDQNAVNHTYTIAGTYTVSLRAYGAGEDEWRQEIRVAAARRLPTQTVVSVVAALAANRVVETRSVPIDQTKDDHPVTFGPHSRTYTETFAAAPGFRITDTRFQEASASRAGDIRAVVASDHGSVTFSFQLTSGPAVDRYRGWLHGTLVLTEERAEPASEVALVRDLHVEDAGTYALSTSVPIERIESVRVLGPQGRILAQGRPTDTLIAVPEQLSFSLTTDAGQAFLTVEPVE